MQGFFEDFKKLHPEKPAAEIPAQNTESAESAATESFEDMKSYFESMKESILTDLRKEIAQIQSGQDANTPGGEDNTSQAELNNEEGGK